MKRNRLKLSILLFLLPVAITVMFNFSAVKAAPGYHVTYATLSDNHHGFTGKIEIANNSNQEIDQWHLEFDWDMHITTVKQAQIESSTGGHYVIACIDQNQIIPPGGKLSLILKGTPGNVTGDPANFKLWDIYDELAEKDLAWQQYRDAKTGAAFQMSLAEGIVYLWTCFESPQPFSVGYQIIERNPVADFIKARYENVTIPTRDGLKLSGIFFPVNHAKGTIVMLHGHSTPALWELPKLQFLINNGYQVLAYNARVWNFHRNPENYIGLIPNDVNDIADAITYLKTRPDVDKCRIGLYGYSYGANKAIISAASNTDVKVVVLDGASAYPPTFLPGVTWAAVADQVMRVYNEHFGEYPEPYRSDPLPSPYINIMSRIKQPVLFIQGLNDTMAPVSNLEALYNAANQPKVSCVFPNSGHCNADTTIDKADYEQKVLLFLDAYLNPYSASTL